ncbi:STAS domain-containing protein [Spirochaetota bacterium]
MDITTVEKNNSLEVKICGDIEMFGLRHLKEKLYGIVENSKKDITIDLSSVEYIDSSGVGVFISLSRDLKKANRNFSLINLPEKISKVFEISSLIDILSEKKISPN